MEAAGAGGCTGGGCEGEGRGALGDNQGLRILRSLRAITKS